MSQDQENHDELDSDLFDMGKATGTGEASVEVTRSNRNRFLLFVGVVGVLSVALVMCIGVSVGAYFLIANRKAEPGQNDGKKKDLPPVAEQRAKIKQVDVTQKAISLVIGTGKVQTFDIGADTRLTDAAGNHLGGVADLEAHRDAFVTILMTEDRQGLQWLKLEPK